MFENLNFGKTGFKTCVLEKYFISYLCILFLIFNALRSFFKNWFIFFKNFVFLEFRLIQSVCWSIEIAFKILSEPLYVSKLIFDQLKIVNKLFLKLDLNLFNSPFSKVFKLFSLQFGQAPSSIFYHFRPNFLQIFPLPRPVFPLHPFFFHLFSVLYAFFHALKGYFRTMHKLGFLTFQAEFCEIDHWVFVLGCYNHDPCGLIWSILWFLRNWKF